MFGGNVCAVVRARKGQDTCVMGQAPEVGSHGDLRADRLLMVHCLGQEGDRAVGKASDERQINQQKK